MNRSAVFEMGNTKVMAVVYGPHEVSSVYKLILSGSCKCQVWYGLDY